MSVAIVRRPTLSVLWLEDDSGFVRVVQSFFRHEGTAPYRVLPWHVNLFAVRTLAEAVAAVDAAPPDMVVADLNVPDSAGAETIESLRRAFPEGPLLILSGWQDSAIGLTAGIHEAEFLAKDHLTPAALWRTIFSALSRSQQGSLPPHRRFR